MISHILVKTHITVDQSLLAWQKKCKTPYIVWEISLTSSGSRIIAENKQALKIGPVDKARHIILVQIPYRSRLSRDKLKPCLTELLSTIIQMNITSVSWMFLISRKSNWNRHSKCQSSVPTVEERDSQKLRSSTAAFKSSCVPYSRSSYFYSGSVHTISGKINHWWIIITVVNTVTNISTHTNLNMIKIKIRKGFSRM